MCIVVNFNSSGHVGFVGDAYTDASGQEICIQKFRNVYQ